MAGSKYTAMIWFFDVFLLLVSTALIYLGTSLIVFYNIDRLDFVTSWYSAVPYFMICTGVANFLTALYGFAAASSENRVHLITYAAILIGLFLVQIAAIFAALELRSEINTDTIESTEVFEALRDYETDPAVQDRWDTLHRQYHCCGGINFNDGYTIWGNVQLKNPNSVPDSCCLIPIQGCGRDILLNQETASQKIYVHGCFSMMSENLKDEVVPLCLGYTGIGTIIALIQIIIIVMAFSRSSSLSRKLKYEEETRSFHDSFGAQLQSSSLATMNSTPRSDRARLNPVAIPQPTFMNNSPGSTV